MKDCKECGARFNTIWDMAAIGRLGEFCDWQTQKASAASGENLCSNCYDARGALAGSSAAGRDGEQGTGIAEGLWPPGSSAADPLAHRHDAMLASTLPFNYSPPQPPAVDYQVIFHCVEAGPDRPGDVRVREEIHLDSPVVTHIWYGDIVRCDNILDPRVARVVTTGEFRMKIRQIFPPKNLEQPEGWVTLYYTQPDGNSGQFFEEYAPFQYQ